MKCRIYRNVFGLSTVSALFFACGNVKEKVNEAGNAAGQVAGEFVEGAVHGASDAFDVKIALSKDLEDKGIRFGKTTVSNDSVGTDNLLTVYVIFEKEFDGSLTAKAFDVKGLEMGRKNQPLKGHAGDAQFIEFHFDKRTNIDSNCKVIVE